MKLPFPVFALNVTCFAISMPIAVSCGLVSFEVAMCGMAAAGLLVMLAASRRSR